MNKDKQINYIMANKITEKKWTENKKRVDFTVKVSPLLDDDYTIKCRILSRVEMKENALKSLVNQIVDRKKEWKENKSNHSLYLNGINATAFILK